MDGRPSGPFFTILPSCLPLPLQRGDKNSISFLTTLAARQIQRWNEILLDCFRKAKRPLHAHRLRALFEGAGLVDVSEQHFMWPTSPWARGVRNKDLGHLWVENLAREAVEALSLALLTRYGGFTRHEALDLAARVTHDLTNTKIHLYQPA